jgi:hydrogenase large subunit
MTKIIIDPLTRIEGHLKIEATTERGIIKDTKSSGTLLRGFEIILKDRDPRDAPQITSRICGVCPTSHCTTSSLCLDNAFGIADKIPRNGRILRNLIQGANFIQSHILHFYHLAALDFVDVTKVADYGGKEPALVSVKNFIARALSEGDMYSLAPFYPRYEGDYRLSIEENQIAVAHYVEAFEARRLAHELSATFSGIIPHQKAIVPGGTTEIASVDKIANFIWQLEQLRQFIDNVYIPDVLTVANAYPDYFSIGKGCGKYLAYGVFNLESSEGELAKQPRFLSPGITSIDTLEHSHLDPSLITEDVKHSWYSSSSGLQPSKGETVPDPYKSDAYSWIKSPRYKGEVYEVGPLARLAVSYTGGNSIVRTALDELMLELGIASTDLASVLGRHAARALETKLVADEMAKWILELEPGAPTYTEYEVPHTAQGMGLWEAPRGALGHWISIKDGKIENYQCVVPTTWNASPRDDKGQPGPLEQAITGTNIKDEENPFEIVRIVRSFDPCLACAVHLITPRGTKLGKFQVC